MAKRSICSPRVRPSRRSASDTTSLSDSTSGCRVWRREKARICRVRVAARPAAALISRTSALTFPVSVSSEPRIRSL